jgi:hypothetical protein
VAIRSHAERALPTTATEQDAMMHEVLDRVGDEVRAQYAAYRRRGYAVHDLAVFVEDFDGGGLRTLVAKPSDIARLLETLAKQNAVPTVNALGKAAPAGQKHVVIAMMRKRMCVLIHRMTVVPGTQVN